MIGSEVETAIGKGIAFPLVALTVSHALRSLSELRITARMTEIVIESGSAGWEFLVKRDMLLTG